MKHDALVAIILAERILYMLLEWWLGKTGRGSVIGLVVDFGARIIIRRNHETKP